MCAPSSDAHPLVMAPLVSCRLGVVPASAATPSVASAAPARAPHSPEQDHDDDRGRTLKEREHYADNVALDNRGAFPRDNGRQVELFLFRHPNARRSRRREGARERPTKAACAEGVLARDQKRRSTAGGAPQHTTIESIECCKDIQNAKRPCRGLAGSLEGGGRSLARSRTLARSLARPTFLQSLPTSPSRTGSKK